METCKNYTILQGTRTKRAIFFQFSMLFQENCEFCAKFSGILLHFLHNFVIFMQKINQSSAPHDRSLDPSLHNPPSTEQLQQQQTAVHIQVCVLYGHIVNLVVSRNCNAARKKAGSTILPYFFCVWVRIQTKSLYM